MYYDIEIMCNIIKYVLQTLNIRVSANSLPNMIFPVHPVQMIDVYTKGRLRVFEKKTLNKQSIRLLD